MLLSSLLYACSFVGFKFWSESIDSTRIIYFRNYVGVSIVLLSLLIRRSVRNSTLQYFQHSGIQMGSLNFCNESLSIIASSINNFVALFIGVAVVQTISNGLQPLFSFLLVFLASCCLPSIYLWKYRKKELARKIVLCIISFVLLFLFYHIS
jgi:hypothetical protein